MGAGHREVTLEIACSVDVNYLPFIYLKYKDMAYEEVRTTTCLPDSCSARLIKAVRSALAPGL